MREQGKIFLTTNNNIRKFNNNKITHVLWVYLYAFNEKKHLGELK